MVGDQLGRTSRHHSVNIAQYQSPGPSLPFESDMSDVPDGSYVNPRGIPQAPFVQKVEDYVKSRDQVEPMIKKFQEMIQKYKYMEVTLSRRLSAIREKIPDLSKNLEMVKFLKSKQGTDAPVTTNYELNDTLYAQATVDAPEVVYLWLGANVMLEYKLDEAITMLEGKLAKAKETEKFCDEDLDFLRENITVLEVNSARLYNWEIQKRRQEKEENDN